MTRKTHNHFTTSSLPLQIIDGVETQNGFESNAPSLQLRGRVDGGGRKSKKENQIKWIKWDGMERERKGDNK